MNVAVHSPASNTASGLSPDFGTPPYPVYRFTVAEYEQLTRAGILTEDSNVELLEGWIVPKMPRNPPHDNVIDLINYLLQKLLPLGWFVRIQNSAVTTDSVPEPDVSVVRGKPGSFPNRHPTGADIGLVIEVADTTILRDRHKAEIYARAGIPHYWIVNLDERQVEIYSQPVSTAASPGYQSRLILREPEAILSVVLDGQAVGKLTVGEILV